ncbi:MAG: type II toxin-antitoxin system RelB/DinJ family antitoxin [Raoultibacter sp.]
MYTTVSARLDAQLKEEAEDVLSSLGISHSAAISALYSQIVLQQGLPFDLRIPRESSRPGLSYWDIRNSVRKLAEFCGIEKVWLFGPYVKGKVQPDSSVDLRIDPCEDVIFDPDSFARDLEKMIGVPVTVSLTDNLSRRFLATVKESEELLFARQ